MLDRLRTALAALRPYLRPATNPLLARLRAAAKAAFGLV
jgi:hypothetical protein